MSLHLDLETRSTVDLKKRGVTVYAQDPTTDVWCAAYAFGDGPIELWTPGAPCPPEIVDHVLEGGEMHAYNANFERVIWREILGPRYGWPVPELEQYVCVMAMAYAMALPGNLEGAAAAVGLEVQKDMAGHRLMMQMAKPRRTEPDGTIVWWDDVDRRERLYAYCKQDVETERQLEKRLFRLRPFERQVWLLDQRINDRGVRIDKETCEQAKKVVADATAKLDAEMRSVTGGRVSACSNVVQLVKWLRENGVKTDSVAKDAVTDLLITELPEHARRALELRQDAAKTSTRKIDAMLTRTAADGRMHDYAQYHGAATGRWAGRGAQVQNFPRPDEMFEDFSRVQQAIETIQTGDHELVDMLFGPAPAVVSNCLRAMITANQDHEIVSADFASIELVVLAWLAEQHDKLDAFRAYQRGDGPDLYKVAASGIFNCDPSDIGKGEKRQIGKVSELALGYQGGVGAFAQMAKGYGLKPAKLAEAYDSVLEASPGYLERAEDAWSSRGRKSGMMKKAWLTAEMIKLAWRQKNDRIMEYWPQLENAAIEAVRNPGAVVAASRNIRYRVAGSFLWCQLPSGRCLCYPYPRLETIMLPWGKEAERIVFKAVDQLSRKWVDKAFYGGLASENVTQAVARDLLAEAMVRVEAADYPVAMHVHDEIVSEVPQGAADLAEFERLMAELPAWAKGCPVSAAGWVGERYRK